MYIVYTVEYINSFKDIEYEQLNSEIFDVINSKVIRDYVTYKPLGQTQNFLFRNVDLSDESITKKINGLLNKITEKNFEKIYEKINLILKNDKIIDHMINKVFDKAIVQTGFCTLYAKICAKFCNNVEEEILSTSIKESLMRKCNEMYIECLKEDDSEKINNNNYSEFCEYMKNKNKLIGIFQFMGNLHKQKLASDDDILTYINLLVQKIKLYQKIDKRKQEQIEVLENLCECLCKLLQTVRDSIILFKELYYTDIQPFSKDVDNFSPRIRFMFLDLGDIFKKLDSKPKYVAKQRSSLLSIKNSNNKNYYQKDNSFTESINSRRRNQRQNYNSNSSTSAGNFNNRRMSYRNKLNKNNRIYSDNLEYSSNNQNISTKYNDKRSKYNKGQKKSYHYKDNDRKYNDYNVDRKQTNSYTSSSNSFSNRFSNNSYKNKKDTKRYKKPTELRNRYNDKQSNSYDINHTENTEELKNKRFDILN